MADAEISRLGIFHPPRVVVEGVLKTESVQRYAEVALAEVGGAIAGIGESVTQGAMTRRQSVLVIVKAVVDHDAALVRIQTRHERGS